MDPTRRLQPGDIRTSRQIYDDGECLSTLRTRVRTGEVTRLWSGCYIPTAVWESLVPQQRALAVHLACLRRARTPITFCHLSAALTHGLSLLHPPQELHLGGDPKPASAHPRVRTHRVPDAGRIRVTTETGLPATSLERTALDCARSLTELEAWIILDQCAARGITRDALVELAAQRPRAHGLRRARRAIDQMDARSGSPAETLARYRIHQAGLPAPDLQTRVETGRDRYYLDLAWPQLRVAVEVDGRAKYRDYGPTDEALIREREREKRIQNLGWVVLRVGWHELRHRPQVFLMRLAECLLAQQLSRGLPPLDLDALRRRLADLPLT